MNTDKTYADPIDHVAEVIQACCRSPRGLRDGNGKPTTT